MAAAGGAKYFITRLDAANRSKRLAARPYSFQSYCLYNYRASSIVCGALESVREVQGEGPAHRERITPRWRQGPWFVSQRTLVRKAVAMIGGT